jgi:hypothetical protein
MNMKKLAIALTAVLLLSSQSRADKISDSFSEVEGTWCYLKRTDDTAAVITAYARLDPTTKKPCTKTGSTEWISIDKVATLSGSEYTCMVHEGGDYHKMDNRMMFSFKYRCKGEGRKWNMRALIVIRPDGNLRVGILK